MKKTKKALLLVLCAILLVGATIAGTVAYLTDTDEVVSNTFTVGNVAITLDEAAVNEYGELILDDSEDENGNPVKVPASRKEDGNKYKLIPGHTYIKDPTITISAGSEKCYVFVKITNGLGDNATFLNSADAEGMNTGWALVADTTNVYAYSTALENAEGKKSATPFNKFTFAADADPAVYKDASITVNAYAIQADGFADVNAAWDAIKTVVLS